MTDLLRQLASLQERVRKLEVGADEPPVAATGGGGTVIDISDTTGSHPVTRYDAFNPTPAIVQLISDPFTVAQGGIYIPWHVSTVHIDTFVSGGSLTQWVGLFNEADVWVGDNWEGGTVYDASDITNAGNYGLGSTRIAAGTYRVFYYAVFGNADLEGHVTDIGAGALILPGTT